MTTLGVLYPGHAAEDDYAIGGDLLLAPVDILIVHTRVDDDMNTIEDARRTGESERLSDGVHELRTRCAATHQRLDAVLWACTAGSFVFGLAGARDQARRISDAAAAPATSTSLAFVEATHALGIRRVAVAATYPAEEAALFGAFMADAGIEVLVIDSAEVADGAGGSLFTDDEVVALAVGADRPDADAILVPDTAIRSMRILDRLEAAAGKPVLTANQVTIWQGLRLAGALQRQPSLGTLFR